MKELMALCKVLGSIVYEFEEQRICGLCCERPREVVFLDCGHIYTCAQCSKYLFKCPIDKKYIRSKYKYRLCDKHGINHSFLSQLSNTNLQTACTTSLNSRVETTMHEDEVLAQFSILKEEYYNYDYFTKCIKCNERTKNVIFEDCCHIVCCYKCSTTLQKCPLDSVEITKKSEVYFS